MYDSYLSANIGKDFFLNVCLLGKSGIFKSPTLTTTTRPEMHIPFPPFPPFMLAYVHGYKLNRTYNIRYVSEDD